MFATTVFGPRAWLVIGFAGQALFTARFVVQWLASERKRDSVVPVAFWWLSMLGGLTLLSYATYRRDPVIMLGQGMGLVVYIRNLMLVDKSRRRAARHRLRAQPTADASEAPAEPGTLPGPQRRVDRPSAV